MTSSTGFNNNYLICDFAQCEFTTRKEVTCEGCKSNVSFGICTYCDSLSSCTSYGCRFSEKIYYAASKGDVDYVKRNLSVKRHNINKILYYAALNGHIEILKVCREKGVNNFKLIENPYWPCDESILKLVKSWRC